MASTVTLTEADNLVDDVLRIVPDKRSPHVTLHVFQTIELNPEFRIRYEALATQYAQLNARIGRYVKQALNRETDREVEVPRGASSLIKNYTRFKP